MDKRQKGFSFMIGPIRRTLTLIVLSVRDMLASAGPVVLLAVGVLVARPTTPKDRDAGHRPGRSQHVAHRQHDQRQGAANRSDHE